MIIQKTLDDESTKRESAHNEFMDFLKKMEEKIFEKFDFELTCKKETEIVGANEDEQIENYVKTKKLTVTEKLANGLRYIRTSSDSNASFFLL